MTSKGDLLDLSTELYFVGYRATDKERIRENAYRWGISDEEINELCDYLRDIQKWAEAVSA